VNADDSATGRKQFDAAAEIQREYRPAIELTREGRRKNQDTHHGLTAKGQESWPEPRERTHTGQSRADGCTKQPFDAAAAEPVRIRKRRGIHGHLRVYADQRGRMPREPSADARVGV